MLKRIINFRIFNMFFKIEIYTLIRESKKAKQIKVLI